MLVLTLLSVEEEQIDFTSFFVLWLQRPFHLPSNINSFVEIYSILTSHEPPMSQRWNEEVRNLLMSLMNPHLSKRIRKLEMLRKHSVYQTWNFVEVQKGSVKPSFVPPVSENICNSITYIHICIINFQNYVK